MSPIPPNNKKACLIRQAFFIEIKVKVFVLNYNCTL